LRAAFAPSSQQRSLRFELVRLHDEERKLALDQVLVCTVDAVSRIGANLRQFPFDLRIARHLFSLLDLVAIGAAARVRQRQ
jgi:hypothetical protein